MVLQPGHKPGGHQMKYSQKKISGIVLLILIVCVAQCLAIPKRCAILSYADGSSIDTGQADIFHIEWTDSIIIVGTHDFYATYPLHGLTGWNYYFKDFQITTHATSLPSNSNKINIQSGKIILPPHTPLPLHLHSSDATHIATFNTLPDNEISISSLLPGSYILSGSNINFKFIITNAQ